MFSKLFSRSRKSPTTTKRNNRFRPFVEGLETRQLMAANVGQELITVVQPEMSKSAPDEHHAPDTLSGEAAMRVLRRVYGTDVDGNVLYPDEFDPRVPGMSGNPKVIKNSQGQEVKVIDVNVVKITIDPNAPAPTTPAPTPSPSPSASPADTNAPGDVPFTAEHSARLMKLGRDIDRFRILGMGREQTVEVIASNGLPVTVTLPAGPGAHPRARELHDASVAFEQRLNSLKDQARTGRINLEQLQELRALVLGTHMRADIKSDPKDYLDPGEVEWELNAQVERELDILFNRRPQDGTSDPSPSSDEPKREVRGWSWQAEPMSAMDSRFPSVAVPESTAQPAVDKRAMLRDARHETQLRNAIMNVDTAALETIIKELQNQTQVSEDGKQATSTGRVYVDMSRGIPRVMVDELQLTPELTSRLRGLLQQVVLLQNRADELKGPFLAAQAAHDSAQGALVQVLGSWERGPRTAELAAMLQAAQSAADAAYTAYAQIMATMDAWGREYDALEEKVVDEIKAILDARPLVTRVLHEGVGDTRFEAIAPKGPSFQVCPENQGYVVRDTYEGEAQIISGPASPRALDNVFAGAGVSDMEPQGRRRTTTINVIPAVDVTRQTTGGLSTRDIDRGIRMFLDQEGITTPPSSTLLAVPPAPPTTNPMPPRPAPISTQPTVTTTGTTPATRRQTVDSPQQQPPRRNVDIESVIGGAFEQEVSRENRERRRQDTIRFLMEGEEAVRREAEENRRRNQTGPTQNNTPTTPTQNNTPTTQEQRQPQSEQHNHPEGASGTGGGVAM